MSEWGSDVRLETIGKEDELIYLPNGLDCDGKIVHEVTMSELVGRDIQLFGSQQFRQNPGYIISQLLSRRVETIGKLKPTINQIRDLLVGDREYLILKLRQISLGDEVSVETICINEDCKQKSDLQFNISDIPIAYGNGKRIIEDLELERGYKDELGILHKIISLRMSNGWDQEIVNSSNRRNLVELADTILARQITKIGNVLGDKLEKMRTKIPLDLPRRDRLIIDEALLDASTGPDSEIEVECKHCGFRYTTGFPFESFFVKAPRSSRKSMV